MNKLVTAIALAAALSGVASAQAAQPPAKDAGMKFACYTGMPDASHCTWLGLGQQSRGAGHAGAALSQGDKAPPADSQQNQQR